MIEVLQELRTYDDIKFFFFDPRRHHTDEKESYL